MIYRRVENAPYDRSRTRTNPGEAKAVAAAVMAHAESQLPLPRNGARRWEWRPSAPPKWMPFSTQLELLRRQGFLAAEEFFRIRPTSRLFVKNLERVQGDERDVIVLSVGYGRTAEGYLSMSFWPAQPCRRRERYLERADHPRAYRCEVFTTLSADDIDPRQDHLGAGGRAQDFPALRR